MMKKISIAFILVTLGICLRAVGITGTCCSLVVPFWGKYKILEPKDSKILNRNLKKGATRLESICKKLSLSCGQVCWEIPNALLRSCNIELPGYNRTCGSKVAPISDRRASIILDDIGLVSDYSAEEVRKSLKKINKYKQSFDPLTVSLVCWVDGLMVVHEKRDSSNSGDKITVALKVASQDDKLGKITSSLNTQISKHLGIPIDKQVACIPLVTFLNLEREQASQLIEQLKELKESLAFDKKSFTVRQFYFKKFCSQKGTTMIGPWEIQNFNLKIVRK